MTTKQQILLRDIIFKKLPGFESTEMQEAILQLTELYPTCIDVENLIEHTLAHKGGYEFVDETAKDFNDQDNSDSKTVTVNARSHKAEISGLETKIGSIRITIFNPLSPESTSFLYIPKDYLPLVWKDCYGKDAGKKRLVITWSPNRPKKPKDKKVLETNGFERIGYFNSFEKFRLDSFNDLAMMTDEKFYQMRPHLRLNTSLPNFDSQADSKNVPMQQISTLCMEETVLP